MTPAVRPGREEILKEIEREHILSTIQETGENYSEAARILGISRMTLYNKVKEYGIGVKKIEQQLISFYTQPEQAIMLRRSWVLDICRPEGPGRFFCSCSMHVGSAIRGSDTVESIGRKIAVTEGEGGRNMSKQRISDRQEEGKELKEMKPVLIVEDEAIMRESLRDWLEDGGYEVETAEQGEEALDKIAKKEFGVAVLDLRLPGENGLEVLKRATEQDPKLKGIIITAYPSIETAVTAMKMGAVNYIVKPFTPDALEKAIQEILGPVQVEIKPDKTSPEPPAEATHL
jgi:DNA-binding NtrC family response regulator